MKKKLVALLSLMVVFTCIVAPICSAAETPSVDGWELGTIIIEEETPL